MTVTDLAKAPILYKSPKSVHKGLSLRDMFPGSSTDFSGGGKAEGPIRMLVSTRPGHWQHGEGFDHFDHALELAEELEERGVRVKILDCAPA